MVSVAADGGHPYTQPLAVAKETTMVTELPLVVTAGCVFVPFMETDFTSDMLTLPCLALSTMVHVNVVVFLHELLTGSMVTFELVGRFELPENKKNAAPSTSTTTTTTATPISNLFSNFGR